MAHGSEDALPPRPRSAGRHVHRPRDTHDLHPARLPAGRLRKQPVDALRRGVALPPGRDGAPDGAGEPPRALSRSSPRRAATIPTARWRPSTAARTTSRTPAAASSTSRCWATPCPCTCGTATRSSRASSPWWTCRTRRSRRTWSATSARSPASSARTASRRIHANHAVLMSVVAQRVGAAEGIPFAVMPHGSALEYAVKRDDRFLRLADGGVRGRRARLRARRRDARAGCTPSSRDVPGLDAKTLDLHLGVDTSQFEPVPRAERRGMAARLLDALDGLPRGRTAAQTDAMLGRAPREARRARRWRTALGAGRGFASKVAGRGPGGKAGRRSTGRTTARCSTWGG